MWSDEFNAPAGTSPDPAKWTYDLGAGGWGNRELETYTDRSANMFQDGAGHLVIRALKTAPENIHPLASRHWGSSQSSTAKSKRV